MRSLLRLLVGGAALGLICFGGVKRARACADAAWRLASNQVSCIEVQRAGDFTQRVKNSCPTSLQISRRDQTQSGTASLTIAAGASDDVALPAPANDGDTAVYDCIAGAQAGELRFAFDEGDCGGCSVSRERPGSGAGSCVTLLALAALGVARRRQHQ